jgi:hypothetical protein
MNATDAPETTSRIANLEIARNAIISSEIFLLIVRVKK